MRSVLRFRMSPADARYGGGLVDGARLLALFGDAATELCIRLDGDEGLLKAYEQIELFAPTRVGDWVEVEAELEKSGATSRTFRFEARRVIAARPDVSASAADVLEPAVVLCRARGTCVVPKDHQRIPRAPR
ncbi:MAG TPA: hotdog domain-containing protein [Anaeromyxobacter sp.]